MVVMYAVMFVSGYEWGHIRLSESRIFMALTMGGAMGLLMLVWMLNMFRDAKVNVAILAATILLLAVGIFLGRSQATVNDIGFIDSMIPDDSMAITRAERAGLQDVQVCELVVAIREARRRELPRNGLASRGHSPQWGCRDTEEPAARPMPDFARAAERRARHRDIGFLTSASGLVGWRIPGPRRHDARQPRAFQRRDVRRNSGPSAATIFVDRFGQWLRGGTEPRAPAASRRGAPLRARRRSTH